MPINLIIVSILIYPLYTWITVQVAMARMKHKIPAPQMEGPEEFLRYLRVQFNTVERLVVFLPLLFINGIYFNDLFAGICGYVWLVGRLIYALGYYKKAANRQLGFLINSVAEAALFLAPIYFLVFGS